MAEWVMMLVSWKHFTLLLNELDLQLLFGSTVEMFCFTKNLILIQK